MTALVSVVMPAKNEAGSVGRVVQGVREVLPEAEVIVVDDGSSDSTVEVCREQGARVVSHPYGMGNGAAIKSGARAAKGDILVFMDADGQHNPRDIPKLLKNIQQGFDMAIGARDNGSHANAGRSIANRFYNRLASYMVGHRIADLTSGLRAVRTQRFREFLHLLPNGFSYPTTITMAFFRAGYGVKFVPITASKREGRSHIRPARDALRFLLIIFRVATLYSPLKLFFPLSVVFGLIGVSYASSTLIMDGRFTNMSVVLLSLSVLTFLIGLVSEQITALMYQGTNRRRASDT